MDIQGQINYWLTGSAEEWDVAQVLLEQGKIRHALFFAHLTLEKILKAHVSRATGTIPPKIHNLARLAEIAKLILPSEHYRFLIKFDVYQMEGRYPDEFRMRVTAKDAKELMFAVKELLEWLKNQF